MKSSNSVIHRPDEGSGNTEKIEDHMEAIAVIYRKKEERKRKTYASREPTPTDPTVMGRWNGSIKR